MVRVVLASVLAAAQAGNLSGHFEGSVPLIIDVQGTFDGSGAKADVLVNVKVAKKKFDCKGEAITETDGSVIFSNSATVGDCLGDAVREDSKDPSKYTITKNSGGTLTFHTDGYPPLRMKKKESLSATGGTLKVTYEDCGAKHAKVTGLSPTTIKTGSSELVTGTGVVDEDVTSAKFEATVTALGKKLTSCSGDGKSDVVCKLPLGVGSITIKAVSYPLKKGAVKIPVEIKTSSLIPPSLANVDVHIAATEQNGESVICLDVHTAKALDSAAAYKSEWEEFQRVQGTRNGDAPQAFKDAVDFVNQENAKGLSYTLSYTGPFAAMEKAEYKQMLGTKPRSMYGDLPKVGSHVHTGEEAPASIDWSTKGAVTAVKNQGGCGSCWAFSSTGGTEGSWEVASGKLQSLSEQQLVDCSKQNSGCNGGLMDYAFAFYEKNNIATEDSYPYTARDGSCKSSFTTAIPSGGVTGYKDVSGESTLENAVATHGPVSVAIEADQSSFQYYAGGVLTASCGTNLDHGVLAVGYGTDAGTAYWKVKNSWGASWGMNGYVLIQKGVNKCGISNEPSYPTVSASLGASTLPDCSTEKCPVLCNCLTSSCKNQLSACFGDSKCKSTQSCVDTCSCSDTKCKLACAAKNPSLKAASLAACGSKHCTSSDVIV